MKNLQEMTLEELWILFPIFLSDYNPLWKRWAEIEINRLNDLLMTFHPIVSHIGSTSIPGIKAKPIVDILVEIPQGIDWAVIKKIMEANNYYCMSESENRISFNKGYTPSGYAEKVFHIHCHRTGDNDEVLFRDYLIVHPELSKQYELLKLSLLPHYKNNRDGYTDAKASFVNYIVNLAKADNIKK